MFGMGMSEILIICAVALLVFGPQQLPEMAKKIAKGLREVRRASDDLRRSIDLDDEDKHRWRPPPKPEPETPKVAAPMPDDTVPAPSDSEVPAAITGSALVNGKHEESSSGVRIVSPGASVAQGSPDPDDVEEKAPQKTQEETTDPQTPSSTRSSGMG